VIHFSTPSLGGTRLVMDLKGRHSKSVRFIEWWAESKVMSSCNTREKVLVIKVIPSTGEEHGAGLLCPWLLRALLLSLSQLTWTPAPAPAPAPALSL